MPRRAVSELNVQQINKLVRNVAEGRAKPGYLRVGGVGGLCLQVKRRGAAGDRLTASWVLRRTINGVRRDLGLGAFPDVTLAGARERARAIMDDVWRGIDPSTERAAARAAATAERARAAAPTVAQAVHAYMNAKVRGVLNPKDQATWESSVLKLVFPLIGSMPISAVTTEDVLRVLQQPVEKRGASEPGSLWTLKPDPASRLRAKLEALFDWAAVHGHRTGDNPARWRGHLAHVLVPTAKLHNGGHQPALPYAEVPAFVAALSARASSPSAGALFFLILTAARSQEVRLAEWPEVDLEAGLWTVPAERMKAGRAHRVPLSDEALALLKRTPPVAGTRLVWPGQGLAKPMSDMTLAAVVRKMHSAELRGERRGWVDPRSGRAAVPHGFRSTFRDWAAEQTSYPSEMAEMALAHRVGSAVEQAYRRTDMLERRRNMMGEWAKFATSALNS